MKTALAFLAAALTPPSLMTLWYLYGQFSIFPSDDPYIWVRTGNFLIICVAISSLHVVLLGLPAYAFLRWRNAVRWWSTIPSGFVLAAIPIAFWSWPLRYPELRTTASFNGVQTMIDGVPTAAGWWQYMESVAFFGLCGALSGLAFWLVLRAMSPNNSLKPTPLSGAA